MLLEKRFPSEEFGTNITWKWLFASVSQNMSCEVALLIERFATKLAWKWLFSFMNVSYVSIEVALDTKHFATIIATKWFFSSMSQNVFFHVGRCWHYFRTKRTSKFLSSDSYGLVFSFGFVSFFSRIWFFSCVRIWVIKFGHCIFNHKATGSIFSFSQRLLLALGFFFFQASDIGNKEDWFVRNIFAIWFRDFYLKQWTFITYFIFYSNAWSQTFN